MSDTVAAEVDYEQVARRGAEAAEDKKATDVMILGLHELSPSCDYFVLASGRTKIQVRAIANAIDDRLKDVPVRRKRQGYRSAGWVLLDYGTVIFHVFLDREREYYDLEGRWSEAEVIYRGENA